MVLLRMEMVSLPGLAFSSFHICDVFCIYDDVTGWSQEVEEHTGNGVFISTFFAPPTPIRQNTFNDSKSQPHTGVAPVAVAKAKTEGKKNNKKRLILYELLWAYVGILLFYPHSVQAWLEPQGFGKIAIAALHSHNINESITVRRAHTKKSGGEKKAKKWTRMGLLNGGVALAPPAHPFFDSPSIKRILHEYIFATVVEHA